GSYAHIWAASWAQGYEAALCDDFKKNIRNFGDGTSNSVLMYETCKENAYSTMGGWTQTTKYLGGGGDFRGSGHNNPGDPNDPINKFEYPGWLPFKFGRLTSAGGAGSLHPGGCHVLLGDGSVRFVSQYIDIK